MKTFGRIMRWLLVIVLLCGGAGGAYAYYLWQHTDEILRQRILVRLQEIAPGWKVEIGRTRFDFQGRIRIYDMKLKGADGQSALFESPEVMVTIDRDKIAEPNPTLHQIRLLRPQLHLVRDLQGKWNWEGPVPAKLAGPLPEWQIEQAQVSVRLEQAGWANAPPFVLRGIDSQLIPSGKRQFKIKAGVKFDLADSVVLEADWNLNDGTWGMGGGVGGLKVGASLLELMSSLSPACAKALEQAAGFAARVLPEKQAAAEAAGGWQPAANGQPGTGEPGTGQPSAENHLAWLGVNAEADLQFRIAKWQPAADLEYSATAVIKQGEVANPLLPFALYGLRGGISLDNRKISIRELSAKNGTTVIRVDGDATHQGDLHPIGLTVDVRDLMLEERVRACLPENRQKVYDSLQPSGKVDVNARLTYNDRDGWSHESDLTARGCTAAHVRFPYQVDQIEGTIKHRGDLLDISMKGMAGQRPVTLKGRVKNPGPEAEGVFDIEGAEIPIDNTLRTACTPAMQATFDTLRLHGMADCHVRLIRPAGPNQKLTYVVVARLRDCSANCKPFPYALSGLSGIVEGVNDNWTFRDLKGRHESAQIQGGGTFRRDEQGRMRLLLGMQATGAALDQQLQSALPEQWQTVWKEFVPTGMLNAQGRVEWTPGEPPGIELDARLIDAGLSMKSFPYTLDDVQAQISLGGGRLTIKSLTGRHEDTRVRMTGSGTFSPGGNWRVRLEDLFVDDLNPDRRFRKTLPTRLREIVETLDPRGKLSLSGTLEFAGSGKPGDTVTAAWNLLTIYSGGTLTTGVDLDNLYGRVTLNGTWDGDRVIGNGQIDLDSVSIKGHQFTNVKGPVMVDGTHLVIGSIDQVNRTEVQEGPPSDNTRRVTADFIDGVISLDGAAVLEKETSYHVRMEMSGGKLERYAQLYLKKRYKLMGLMNGWVDFFGRGTSAQRLKGRGRLVISPAALYELPVIVAIFKILNLAPVDKTAFRQAEVVFDIGGGQFQLRRADLNGDAITLRGRGYIPFDGPLSLDFYSAAGRSQLPIPIVGPLIGGATTGWVEVQVRGTMSDPVATVRALPQMADALRAFLGIFDPRAPGPNPRGASQQRPPRG